MITEAQVEWAQHLAGILRTAELVHEENRSRVAERQAADREHALIMLGYNQAMLDYAAFPIKDGSEDDAPVSREQIEKVAKDLREKLGRS